MVTEPGLKVEQYESILAGWGCHVTKQTHPLPLGMCPCCL